MFLIVQCVRNNYTYMYTTMINTYFLFGVSAKHFNDDVSTTVSQNATTGSDTLISVCTKMH